MRSTTKLDQELFRILLFRDDAAELLLERSSSGVRLPQVSVPAHTRTAEEITAAVKSSWNLETYCLFTLPAGPASEDGARHVVLEACRDDSLSPGMHWLPVVSCSAACFDDPCEFATMENSLAMLQQHRRGELPGPFGKPGWLPVVTEWVQAQAAGAGLALTGEFRQFNASPAFSLIRFKTDGPALWFKAVGEPNLHEHRITLKLASLFPRFLPRILASHPEWNAWLALESEGSELGENATTDAWGTAAENLALLQISSFGRRFELIHSGCKDLRPCRLVELVDPFLDAMAEFMERQTKLAPAPLSREKLLSLGRNITMSLEELDECAIPNTVGHLDVNPGNLLVCGPRCVFLDWAEGYVGPPFFAFQYLLENLRRLQGEDANRDKSLVLAYEKHWARFASPKEIVKALKTTPLLATFTCAASIGSWRNRQNIRTESAGYLRSLTRRMQREANALEDRRPVCVP
jgi:hypothetical protein